MEKNILIYSINPAEEIKELKLKKNEIIKGIISHNIYPKHDNILKINEISSDFLIKNKISIIILFDSVLKWENISFLINKINYHVILHNKYRKKININNLIINKSYIYNEKYLINKSVLITGGAGSIGKATIIKLIDIKKLKQIIIIDNNESAIHNLIEDIEMKFPSIAANIIYIISDIRNEYNLKHIFNRYKPNIIIHCAAYKHVYLMENNITEAINNNIKGTMIIADLADKHKIEKFIFISTDKAVEPKSIMGMTKKISEIYLSYLNQTSYTKFIITRFVNVLKSNGSVICTFENNITKYNKIRVNSINARRFFITTQEAVCLILSSICLGKKNNIFVPKSYLNINILDMAKIFLYLQSKKIYSQTEIQICKLKNGEKIKEKLINDNEEKNVIYKDKNIKILNNTKKYNKKIIFKLKSITQISYDVDEVSLKNKLNEILQE